MKVEDSYTIDEKAIALRLGVTCEAVRKLIEIKRRFEEDRSAFWGGENPQVRNDKVGG